MTSREYKKVILAALLIVLAFIIGVMIGFFSRAALVKNESEPSILDTLNREEDEGITQRLADHISKENLDKNLRKLTEKPRLAGTEGSKDAAQYVHKEFLRYGLESEIVEYDVTLSYPESSSDNYVAITDRDGKELFRTSTSTDDFEVPPYNAFSPSGQVEGNLVFANYARERDFEDLKKKGINCSNVIVIAKYGMGFRGNKVENAYRAGAKGIILYSDPQDYAMQAESVGVYPDSIYLPDNGAQRGNIVLNKGDQSTPGYPANEFATKLTDSELKARLPKIPCLPISYGNALHVLREMAGDKVYMGWPGLLNITYRFGPDLVGGKKVVLKVRNRLESKKIYNVIADIKGLIEPDRSIIVGNHRDAWVYGSVDPMSGGIIMMEVARVFGLLLQEGWRPRRSIKFCSWDAEEFGLVGSFEWVEDFRKWLTSHAVAYINVDSGVSGNETLYLKTVPLLQSVFEKAADKFPDPNGKYKTAYEAWSNHPSHKVLPVGGGSDHVPFTAHLGISSMYPKYAYVKNFWRSTSSPLYHSKFETYDAFKLIDPEYEFARSMTSIISEIVRDLSDSLIIPFDIENLARSVKGAVKDLERGYSDVITEKQKSWLSKAVEIFHDSSIVFAFSLKMDKNPITIRDLNDRMLWLERSFIVEEGLPGNPTFRHILFSPGTINYYAGMSFPGLGGIHECTENSTSTQCHLEVQRHVSIIIYHIMSAAKILKG